MQLMFPRHVLQHLIRSSVVAPEPGVGSALAECGLATSHSNVTILFCDICGETK